MTIINRHLLVRQDLRDIVAHVRHVSGDAAAASRRLDEVEAIVESIIQAPTSGTRLSGALDGWLVRHGGRGRMITVVFRHDPLADEVQVAIVAFGYQDWASKAQIRRSAFERT